MTNRRKLEGQRRSLAEVRDIMNSMKTLAYMETRKLTRFLDAQHTVVNSIETVAADFVSAYPKTLAPGVATRAAYILIGSERGFCGDFNETVIHHLDGMADNQARDAAPLIIAIGHKLCTRLAGDARVVSAIGGAGVAEEVGTVLSRTVDSLLDLQTQHGTLTVHALYHALDKDHVVTRQLMPAFQDYADNPPRFSVPPVLNLEPERFSLELLDQYLFATINEIFYTSLMAENIQRAQHLEGAVQHLEEKAAALKRRSNALRQEEIIEEIEVILLTQTELTATHGPQ